VKCEADFTGANPAFIDFAKSAKPIEKQPNKAPCPSVAGSCPERLKKTTSILTDRVTISTIHSAKGLDYSVVFLLGLDYLTPKGWIEDQIANLTYVGITRARYRLIIPYINQTPLIDKIQKALAG